MNALIIEDEHHNFKMLKGMIEQIKPDWQIFGPIESVAKAVEWFDNNPAPDLIFLDIQLVDGISFLIFDEISIDSMIIFTTAYDEYALRAFKVNSIDYLLKPIKQKDLTSAIEKFESFQNKQDKETISHDYSDILQAIMNGEKKYRTRFLISRATASYKLNADEIALFYTENRVVWAVTYKGEEHIIDLTMERLEEQLNPEIFFRANRSIILNIDSVLKIEAYFGGKIFVKLVHPLKQEVTISRLKATAFKKWLGA